MSSTWSRYCVDAAQTHYNPRTTGEFHACVCQIESNHISSQSSINFAKLNSLSTPTLVVYVNRAFTTGLRFHGVLEASVGRDPSNLLATLRFDEDIRPGVPAITTVSQLAILALLVAMDLRSEMSGLFRLRGFRSGRLQLSFLVELLACEYGDLLPGNGLRGSHVIALVWGLARVFALESTVEDGHVKRGQVGNVNLRLGELECSSMSVEVAYEFENAATLSDVVSATSCLIHSCKLSEEGRRRLNWACACAVGGTGTDDVGDDVPSEGCVEDGAMDISRHVRNIVDVGVLLSQFFSR